MRKYIFVFLFSFLLVSCGSSNSSSFNSKKFAGRYKIDLCSPAPQFQNAYEEVFANMLVSMLTVGTDVDILFYEKGDGMLKCKLPIISLFAPKINEPMPFRWCITKDSVLNFINDSTGAKEPIYILRKVNGTYDFVNACDCESHEPIFLLTRQN